MERWRSRFDSLGRISIRRGLFRRDDGCRLGSASGTLLEELGNERGPAGLVTRAEASSGVPVEILVEQHQIVGR